MAELEARRLWSQLLLQRRNLLIAVVLLVASAALLIFGTMPFWTRSRVVQADITREKISLQRIQQRAALLTNIGPEEQNSFRRAGQALPLGKQPLVVLQSLEAVATEAKVSLGKYDLNPGLISTQAAETTRRVTRTKQARAAQAQVMPLSVEVVGQFSDIQRTIDLIEDSLPLMEVVEMSLNPEHQTDFSTPTTSYIANLLLNTYYAPLNAKDLAKQGAAALSKAQQDTLALITGMTYRLTTAIDDTTAPPEFNNPNLFGVNQPTAVEASPPTPTPSPVPELPTETVTIGVTEGAAPEKPVETAPTQ